MFHFTIPFLLFIVLTQSASATRISFGQTFARPGYVYNGSANSSRAIGVRDGQLVMDNQINSLQFVEVESKFMAWPSAPGHFAHYGHLKLGGQCVGIRQSGLDRMPLVIFECSDQDDASQLLQYWLWDDNSNDLTFIGNQAWTGFVPYYVNEPEPESEDDALYLAPRVERVWSTLTFGKHVMLPSPV